MVWALGTWPGQDGRGTMSSTPNPRRPGTHAVPPDCPEQIQRSPALLARDRPGRRGNPSQHPASTWPARSSRGRAFSACRSPNTQQLLCVAIKHAFDQQNGKTCQSEHEHRLYGKTVKGSLMVRRLRRSLFLVNSDDPRGWPGDSSAIWTSRPAAAQPGRQGNPVVRDPLTFN